MNEREELAALRRMAELEAKAGAMPQNMPSESYDKRIDKVAGTIERAKSGQIGTTQAGFQVLGQGLGTINDKMIEAIPQGVKDAAGYGFRTFMDSNPMLAASNWAMGVAAPEIAGRYQRFAQNNPNAAANLEAAGNLASVASLIVPGPRAVNIATDATKVGGKQLAAVANKLPAIGESGVSRKAVEKAASAIDLSGIPATSQNLRAAASPFYKKFEQSGGVYGPQLTNEIADMAAASRSKGVAGQMKAADVALNDSLAFYENLRGKALGVEDLQALDQSLAEDVARFNRVGEYSFGRKLNDLKYALREKVYNPDSAIKYIQSGDPAAVNDLLAGNKLWSESYKAADLEKILQKAQGTNTPQTSIRTGIKNLLANENKMARYSEADKAALQEAMKRGNLGALLYNAGGRLTDSLAGMVAGSAGGPVGSIAGAVAGKAIGGGLADIAGNVQAKRLAGAASAMQKSLPQNAKIAAALSNKEIAQRALKRSGLSLADFQNLPADKQAFYLGVKK